MEGAAGEEVATPVSEEGLGYGAAVAALPPRVLRFGPPGVELDALGVFVVSGIVRGLRWTWVTAEVAASASGRFGETVWF